MNIYQKMAAVTAELQTVAKNLNVATGQGKSYKAVSERDIIDAVKPIEVKHGIYSYPCDRQILESQTLESETQYGIKTTFFTRIMTTYRFVNVDDPTDFIETVTFAEGIDSQDKGSGKAQTYCDKYALMKAYKISTGDDPDQYASEESHYTKSGLRCSDCGINIVSTKNRAGETWSANDIAGYSEKRFGRTLCPDCQKKALKAE